ncbi:MAG: RNA-binding cell elongation regulator Jag/EloR [Actinomycetota bacterium]|nr:RNA-binding cell elongation regulator Jag/EloR [Actinomycetota bacterium]
MINEIIKEGPSVAEALDFALEEMGVQQDAVQYEVLDEGGRGFFGAGKPASVRVWLKPGEVARVSAQLAEPADIVLEEEEAPLTDEELDKIADEAVGVVNSVLATLGIESEIEEYEGDDNEIILDIVGDDLGVLIGRHGKTLDALQVLVAAMTNRRIGRRFPVVVDVSGYRYRRKVKLEEIARRAADRVVRQGRPVELRPMTSFERKAVHVALRNDRRVTTASEGDEPYRQVVVHPK